MESDDKKSRYKRLKDWDIDKQFEISKRAKDGAKKLWQTIWFRRVVYGVIAVFSVVLLIGLFTGQLAGWYRFLFEMFLGRQWTYVMRDYPWAFAILALVVLFPVVISFGPWKWKTFVIIYVAVLVGFLGGHVFWGSSGPGNSHCFNSAFEFRVDPHNKYVAAEELGELDTAIVLRVSVTARKDQPRSAFDVNVDALVGEIEKRADVEIDQLWIGDTPYVQAVVIRPTGGGSIPDGKYEGQVTVSDAQSGEMCPMREPYKIEIGS